MPALLVVTGLRSEAEIAAGEGVATVCSGGDPQVLQMKLSRIFSARPREGGDPESKELDSRFRGNERAGTSRAASGGAEIRAILSFGLAGGLAPDLHPGDVILATHVAADDARYGVSLNWLDEITAKLAGAVTVHTGLVAGTDAVLTKSADKDALHALSGALAVDMESHITADFAQRHGLPFAVIRAVSDPATRSLPPLAANALTLDGDVALAKVIGGLLRHPAQLPALIAAGADSRRAFASLRRCRGLLGPLFGLGGADL
jgi:adenosylhomocysteine nucleosidase